MRGDRRSVQVQASFIGCPTNILMLAIVGGTMAAGRFGLIAGTRYRMNDKLEMVRNDPGIATGDPDGYNWVDVMAHGSFGHILGVGTVLGLKTLGVIPWADYL